VINSKKTIKKSMDLFIESCEGNCIKIFLWNHDNWEFAENIWINSSKITGCTPGDFNFDGKLDVMVSTKDTTGEKNEIYLQNNQNLNKTNQNIYSSDQILSLGKKK
jgi:hypothetical protein